MALALVAVDLVVRAGFPRLPRLADNFSSHYLTREIATLGPDDVLFCGDSVLWGYGVAANDAAVPLLARTRPHDVDLAFEGGGPANTYALARLVTRAGMRPRALVFNVNLVEFSAFDSAYARLYPPVEDLAWSLLTPAQRARLQPTRTETLDARVDRALDRVSALYGMRSDLRSTLFGAVDAAHAVQALVERASGAAARRARAHRPTAEAFEGVYDLAPIADDNVAWLFLGDLAELHRATGLPMIAILTPTNHALLHDDIDVPGYDANLARVAAMLRRAGVRVVDLDRAVPGSEFLDNDHLTARGNRRLAAILARVTP